MGRPGCSQHPGLRIERLRPLVRAHERQRAVVVRELPEGAEPLGWEVDEVLEGAGASAHRREPPSVPADCASGPVSDLVGRAEGGRAVGCLTSAFASTRSPGRQRGSPGEPRASGRLRCSGNGTRASCRLADRMEVRLGESGAALETLRWTAETVTRAHLVRGFRYGVGVAVYFGHGRPEGWAGYHGLRARHLAEAGGEPLGAVLSVTCLTASRWRTGLAVLARSSRRPASPPARSARLACRSRREHAVDARPRRRASRRRAAPRRRRSCAARAVRGRPVSYPRRPARGARGHLGGSRAAESSRRTGARMGVTENDLAAIVAEVAEIDAGEIKPHVPLAQAGIDSLMAVEIAVDVERRYGIRFDEPELQRSDLRRPRRAHPFKLPSGAA